MEILSSLGLCLSTAGKPWVLGGDFNMEPSDIGGSRFVSELRAAMVDPKAPTHFPAGPPSTFDSFVVSGGLSKAIDRIEA
eukprot:7448402-Pyramimonas_sp.AAC.1